MSLNWRHHALIQSLLSRGPLAEEDFHSVFSGITGGNPVGNQQQFNDFLLKINKELAYVKFELRGCRNQYDGEVYYGVVNNLSDEPAKLGTKYSIPQIAFYKAVLEAISQDAASQGFIGHFDALNLQLDSQVQSIQNTQDTQSRTPYAIKSFTISLKEKTLADLIQDRWLCSTADGKVGLGIRSFLDLRSWFHANDIPSCDVCNEAGVKAVLCPNRECTVRIHDYCLRKKFSQKKALRTCSACGTEWHPPEGFDSGPRLVSHDRVATRSSRNTMKTNADTEAPARHEEESPVEKRPRSCKMEVEDGDARVSQQPIRSSNRLRTHRSSQSR